MADEEQIAGLARRLDRIEQSLEGALGRLVAIENRSNPNPVSEITARAEPPQTAELKAAFPLESAPPTAAPEPLVIVPPYKQQIPLEPGPPPLPPKRPSLEPVPNPAFHEDHANPVLPPKSAPIPPTPAGPPPEPAWHEILRNLKLLPPAMGESMEVQVGTWWLTRIGALIMVIGAVFFGIYVSQFASPAGRLAELIVGALGAALFGLWMEKRYAQFGGVIFAASLAVLYFAAFGAFAVKAIKVIDDPAWGMFWQFAAAAGIVGAALWRNAPTIAIMATLCGFVACLFSFAQGYDDFALVASFLLSVGAVEIERFKRWREPRQISVPLAYVVYGAIVADGWRGLEIPPSFLTIVAYPLACMTLFIAADWHEGQAGKIMPRRRRVLMLCNTTGAVLLTLFAVGELQPDYFAEFYFTFGGALLAAALVYWRTRPADPMIHVFFIKASALITMGLITEFKGRARWVALAIQSLVLVFSAKYSKRRLPEFLSTATWLISFCFFAGDWPWPSRFSVRPVLFSVPGMMGIAYLLFSSWLFCVKLRWLRRGNELLPDAKISNREWRAVALTQFAGIAAILMIQSCVPATMRPMAIVMMGVAMAAMARVGRHWVAACGALLPLLAGHLWFRMEYRGPQIVPVMDGLEDQLLALPPEPHLWLNAIVVVGLTLAGALAADEWWAARRGPAAGKKIAIPVAALHLLWIFSLMTALIATAPTGLYMLLAVGLACGLAVASTRLRHLHLADLALFPLALAPYDLMLDGGEIDWGIMLARMREPGAMAWLLPPAAAGAFGFAAMCAAWPRVRERFILLAPHRACEWMHAALATVIGLAVMVALLDRDGIENYWLMLTFGLAAMAVASLGHWPGLRPAFASALFYLICAYAGFEGNVYSYGVSGDSVFIAFSLAIAALTLLLAMRNGWFAPSLDAELRIPLQWGLGLGSLILMLMLFDFQKGRLAVYTTVFWGLSSMAIFLTGLAGRVRPLRLVSLIGLAFCVGRIFLVDAHSTLQRVYAFLGVGAVLMLVSFLYNKYRDRIQHLG